MPVKYLQIRRNKTNDAKVLNAISNVKLWAEISINT